MIRKVLIVDDDQILLRALEKKLAKYKETFSMIMCKDGFDAAKMLEGQYVSLIVMDLKMPRMDGIALLAQVKEKYPDIPVIIISGYRTADLYALAKKKGVVAYISKPFQVDDLAKVILSTLQKEAEGGTMNNVSPVVFLQLMEMEGKTSTIRIVDKKSRRGGVLYFHDGNLIDARMNEIYGIDAAYILFGWEDVTLFIQNECPSRKNVINSDLQPIIMKAVEMKDELDEAAREQGPVAEDEYEKLFMESEKLFEESIIPEDSSQLKEESIPDIFKEDEEPVGSAAAPPATGVKLSFEDQVRTLLEKEVGERCGLEDIYKDENMKEIVRSFSDLGALFQFGSLKFAYIQRGKETDQILIPGKGTTVIDLSAKAPQDKIIRVLSEKLHRSS